VNPDRCEWSLTGWINQKTFLIRLDIHYIDACLFLILVPSSVDVAISCSRRLIHDFHIQISFNAASQQAEGIATFKIGPTSFPLLSNPFLRFRQLSAFQPAIWIVHNYAMDNFLN
jgi:hypothetical protein